MYWSPENVSSTWTVLTRHSLATTTLQDQGRKSHWLIKTLSIEDIDLAAYD
jgi:hypothetical protein